MIINIILALAGFSRIIILDGDLKPTLESCNKNGFPGLYDQVRKSSDLFSSCVDSDLIRALLSDDLILFFNKACEKRPNFELCIADKINLSKQCLNEKNRLLFEAWEKIDNELLDYVCKNDVIKHAFSETQFDCWTKHVPEALKNCSHETFTAFFGSSYSESQKFTCDDDKKTEICLKTVLPEYCNKNVTNLFTIALTTIGKNLCKFEYMESSPHHRIARAIGPSQKMEHLERKAKNLCEVNGHPSNKMEDTLGEMKTCLRQKPIFATPKQEFLDHVTKCTKPAIDLFETCLPEKYKYLPKLLLSILESVVGLLYDDFIIIGSELGPCLPKLDSMESQAEYESCLEKVSVTIGDDLVDSKEKFCENWIPMNECYIKQIKKDCKATPELAKFENDFRVAVDKPCKTKK